MVNFPPLNMLTYLLCYLNNAGIPAAAFLLFVMPSWSVDATCLLGPVLRALWKTWEGLRYEEASKTLKGWSIGLNTNWCLGKIAVR